MCGKGTMYLIRGISTVIRLRKPLIFKAFCSSPTRTIAGLASFKDKVILIAGGYDKHLDHTDMGRYVVDHVKSLF